MLLGSSIYLYSHSRGLRQFKKEIAKAKKAIQPDENLPGENAKTPKPKAGAKAKAKNEEKTGTRKRKAKPGAEGEGGEDGDEATAKPARRLRKAAKQ